MRLSPHLSLILANGLLLRRVKPRGAVGQSRRQRFNQPIHAVEMALCEPKATLTVGVSFNFGFPLPISRTKCVLGVEEARVRESTGPCPQRAHRLWEKPGSMPG